MGREVIFFFFSQYVDGCYFSELSGGINFLFFVYCGNHALAFLSDPYYSFP